MHTLVVGAGSAGTVIAVRLSERADHEVTLLEAGPDYLTVQTTPEDLRDGRRNSTKAHDWGFQYQPVVLDRTFNFPRGRVVGGSSAVNTCIALRGHPYDYDEWASLGLTEWSFAKCLPAFKRLEHDLDFTDEWHGKGGPIPIRRHPPNELVPWQAAFVEAARAVGYPETVDHNNPELPCGVGPHAMNKVGGERMSVARCYLTAEVRRRPNLHVMAGVHVRRVLFENAKFAGLEIEREGNVEILRADRVVISSGALATPGILLRSGVGPKAELARLGVDCVIDSPTVGEKLLDHPGAGMLIAPKADIASASQPIIQTMLRYTSRRSEHPFDMQLQAGSWLPLFGMNLPVVALMCCIGKPRGHGTVRWPSADPRAKPRVDSRFLEHRDDRARAVEAIERMWQLMRQQPLRELGFAFYPDASVLERRERIDAIISRVCGSGYHPCGTVPMSAERIEEGAVDAHGRVRGVEGVFVADASIMPTIPSSNTNLATIMIGERIGEWLRD